MTNNKKAIPHAKLVECENAGHVPHFEAPKLFNNALLVFLAIH
jgi:pimeloyl-ACP methyl ester carboxylesterase